MYFGFHEAPFQYKNVLNQYIKPKRAGTELSRFN